MINFVNLNLQLHSIITRFGNVCFLRYRTFLHYIHYLWTFPYHKWLSDTLFSQLSPACICLIKKQLNFSKLIFSKENKASAGACITVGADVSDYLKPTIVERGSGSGGVKCRSNIALLARLSICLHPWVLRTYCLSEIRAKLSTAAVCQATAPEMYYFI